MSLYKFMQNDRFLPVLCPDSFKEFAAHPILECRHIMKLSDIACPLFHIPVTVSMIQLHKNRNQMMLGTAQKCFVTFPVNSHFFQYFLFNHGRTDQPVQTFNIKYTGCTGSISLIVFKIYTGVSRKTVYTSQELKTKSSIFLSLFELGSEMNLMLLDHFPPEQPVPYRENTFLSLSSKYAFSVLHGHKISSAVL